MKKRGISLITLVITIIVVIILAGAVVLNLSNNNPIEGATKAVVMQDIEAFRTELLLKLTSDFILDTENINAVTKEDILRYIPSMENRKVGSTLYTDILVISEGELKVDEPKATAKITSGDLSAEQYDWIVSALGTDVFNATTYTIKYYMNDGTDTYIESSKIHNVKYSIQANSADREGYGFKNWNTSADGTGTTYNAGDEYTENAELTLYAQWETGTYTITYNKNDGTTDATTALKTTDVEYTIESKDFTREGYTFAGYNTQADGKGTDYAVGASYTENANLDLYAKWTLITYEVTYDANNGINAPSAQTKNHGQELTLSTEEPTRSGYVFTGWNTNADGKGIAYNAGESYTENESITLYAQWEAGTYTITYKKNDGTEEEKTDSKATDAEYTIVDQAFEREGYTFVGYNTQPDGKGTDYAVGASYTVNAELILYAQWTIHVSNLTVDPNGGYATVDSEKITESKTYTQNAFTTLSYTKPEKSETTSTSKRSVTYNYNGSGASDSTVYANRTIVYEYSNGSWTKSSPFYGEMSSLTAAGTYTFPADNDVTSTITASYTRSTKSDTTSSVTLPSPTRSGYTFEGWYTNSSGTGTKHAGGSSYTPSSNVTLYAKWKAVTYTVTYNANNGTGAPSAQTKIHGTSLTLSSTRPTRSGYVFTGWNTKADGTGTAYSAGGSYTANANLTLYAQWEAGAYTITYKKNDGTEDEKTASKTTDVAYTIASQGFTREGYTFAGYNTKADGTGTPYSVGTSYTTNAELTLYAQWEINVSKLTVNPNGGYATVNSTKITSSKTYTQNAGTTLSYTKPERSNSTSTSKYSVTYNYNGNGTTSNTVYANRTKVYQYSNGTWGKSSPFYGSISSLTSSGTYTFPTSNNVTSTITASYTSSLISDTTESVTLPSPTWSGHTFNGWYNGSTKVGNAGASYTPTGSVTLTASWSQNTSSLTVNPNGGYATVDSTKITSSKTYTQNAGTTLSYTKPEKSETTSTSKYSVTYNYNGSGASNSTVYANRTKVYQYSNGTWEKSSPFYGTMSSLTAAGTYTFPTDNNVTSTITASYTRSTKSDTTSSVTLPSPTRSGYTFEGWNTNSSGTGTNYAGGSSYTPSADVTLYAKWKAITYTVTYNANNGTGAPSAQTKIHGQSLTLSSTKPTRTGYTFESWNTKADGTGTTYSAGGSYTANTNLTLYAIWVIDALAVKTNPSKYYGAYVDYSPKNGCPVKWRIFYADSTRIYLIAEDYVENKYLTATGLTKSTSTDNNFKDYCVFSNVSRSDFVTRLTTSSYYSEFKDTAGKANSVVGAPTLEQFKTSYNAVNTTSSKQINTLNCSAGQSVSGLPVGEPGSQAGVAYASGYVLRFGTSGNYAYYITIPTDANKKDLYVRENTANALTMCLASISAINTDSIVAMGYLRHLSTLVYNYPYIGCRPLVNLKSGVELVDPDGNGTYSLQ